MNLLSLSNWRITFRTAHGDLRAVRGLDLQIAEGECVGLVGESGSGKSVTGLSVLDLLPPTARTEGRRLWQGEDTSTWSAQRWRDFRGREVAMIFQEPGRSFDPLTTVRQNFRETLLAHQKLSPEEVQRRTLELLHEVRLPDPEKRLDNYPHQFSGGMLQRLMIALALAHRPRLLIADEPTTALDVTIQAQIIRLLKTLQREHRLAVLFITHNLALLRDFVDRIVVLYGGLAMEEGPAEEILARPRHPYTHLLLSSLIRPGERHEERTLPESTGQPPDPLDPPPGCPFQPRCPLAQESCARGVPAWRKRLRCRVVNGDDDASA